jgi:hypothetical protein
MAGVEQLEMDAYRAKLAANVSRLVDKYRSIFEWDVPDIDESLSDRLILAAIREALDRIESHLS